MVDRRLDGTSQQRRRIYTEDEQWDEKGGEDQ